MDYVKSSRHVETFLHAAPELVIVDEAHTCTDASAGAGEASALPAVSRLAEHASRHLLSSRQLPTRARKRPSAP